MAVVCSLVSTDGACSVTGVRCARPCSKQSSCLQPFACHSIDLQMDVGKNLSTEFLLRRTPGQTLVSRVTGYSYRHSALF
jgi:hypothetical protein